MIKIENINWLSEEAKEAEVYLFDGNFRIISFSHPFNQNVGDSVLLPLYTLNADRIYKLNSEKKFLVEKEGTAFEYSLSGLVVNKDSSQIKIGEFIIQLDVPLPGDIELGDYISFTCDRIDIY